MSEFAGSTEGAVHANYDKNNLLLIVGDIWCDIIGVREVKAQDDFFALGGDSLMMMTMLFHINSKLNIELPPVILFESSTLDEFCDAIKLLIDDAL